MAAKLPLPKRIFGHGWILSDEKKMSKSLGNILDPLEIIKDYDLGQQAASCSSLLTTV